MQHLAMIADGNRRWATHNKLATFLGHQKGIDSVKIAIKACLKNNIKYLSLYIFSLENFNRSAAEKKYLFKLISGATTTILPDMIKQNIKVRFVGDRTFFPNEQLIAIEEIEDQTKDFTRLNLNLLFCYGGQQELVHATKQIAQRVKDGSLAIDTIDTTTLDKALWTKNIPNPDLIIRTGDVIRLSNFLLYQAAYSELVFLPCMWPELTEQKLQTCIDNFSGVQRNFGY